MALFALFLAKLFDPLSLIIAGVSGYKLFNKPWYATLVIGIITSIIIEITLTSTQLTRTFGQGLPLGVVASCVHALIGRFIAKKRNAGK